MSVVIDPLIQPETETVVFSEELPTEQVIAVLDKPKRGRPKGQKNRQIIVNKLRDGAGQVDRNWLLEQLLTLYAGRGILARDKLRALELMAKLSGFDKNETPEDEKKAIADLIKTLEGKNV